MPRRHDDPPEDPDAVLARAVPMGVRIAGAWSWRLIGVLALFAALVFVVGELHIVVIPIAVAVLLSALLTPGKRWLIRHGLPRWAAVVIVFVGLLVVIAGLLTLVIVTFRAGLPSFETQVAKSYAKFLTFLKTAPFGFSDTDLQNLITSLTKTIKANGGSIAAGALAGFSTVGDIGIGLLLALFSTLFFVLDGPGIWSWVVRLFPHRARAAVDGAANAAWLSIGEYVRVQVIVALIDAVGVGLVAFILRLQFVFPIAVLVFLGAFIPIVGAVSAGALAVVVALVDPGLIPQSTPTQAVIMLAGLIAVNQVEAHILQPLLMGNAVRLHPVAVVLSVALGSLLGGIAGAVFAVPTAAALNSAVKYVAGGRWKGQPEPGTSPPKDDEATPSPRRNRRPRPQDVTTVG